MDAVYEEADEVPTNESLADQAIQGENEFETLTQTLEQWITSYKDILDTTLKSGVNPYKLAMEELDANNFNASVDTRKSMIQRIKDFLKIKGVEV